MSTNEIDIKNLIKTEFVMIDDKDKKDSFEIEVFQQKNKGVLFDSITPFSNRLEKFLRDHEEVLNKANDKNNYDGTIGWKLGKETYNKRRKQLKKLKTELNEQLLVRPCNTEGNLYAICLKILKKEPAFSLFKSFIWELKKIMAEVEKDKIKLHLKPNQKFSEILEKYNIIKNDEENYNNLKWETGRCGLDLMENDTLLSKGTVYVRSIDGKIAYSTITPESVGVKDVITNIEAPIKFTLENVKHLKDEIFSKIINDKNMNEILTKKEFSQNLEEQKKKMNEELDKKLVETEIKFNNQVEKEVSEKFELKEKELQEHFDKENLGIISTQKHLEGNIKDLKGEIVILKNTIYEQNKVNEELNQQFVEQKKINEEFDKKLEEKLKEQKQELIKTMKEEMHSNKQNSSPTSTEGSELSLLSIEDSMTPETPTLLHRNKNIVPNGGSQSPFLQAGLTNFGEQFEMENSPSWTENTNSLNSNDKSINTNSNSFGNNQNIIFNQPPSVTNDPLQKIKRHELGHLAQLPYSIIQKINKSLKQLKELGIEYDIENTENKIEGWIKQCKPGGGGVRSSDVLDMLQLYDELKSEMNNKTVGGNSLKIENEIIFNNTLN